MTGAASLQATQEETPASQGGVVLRKPSGWHWWGRVADLIALRLKPPTAWMSASRKCLSHLEYLSLAFSAEGYMECMCLSLCGSVAWHTSPPLSRELYDARTCPGSGHFTGQLFENPDIAPHWLSPGRCLKFVSWFWPESPLKRFWVFTSLATP